MAFRHVTESLRCFGAQSGIKGLNFLASAKSRLEKFVWIFALIVTSALTIKDVTQSIMIYQSGSTITNLKMHTVSPVKIEGLKVCLQFSMDNLKFLKPENHLNISWFHSEITDDLTQLKMNDIDISILPIALVLVITQYELIASNDEGFAAAEIAYKLLHKFFPNISHAFNDIVKHLCSIIWLNLNQTIEEEKTFEANTIVKRNVSLMSWLGSALKSNSFQYCFTVDPEILDFYDRTSRVLIKLNHLSMFNQLQPVYVALLFGSSLFLSPDAENVFLFPVGRKYRIYVRQIGQFSILSKRKSVCSSDEISYAESFLRNQNEWFKKTFQCSLLVSTFLGNYSPGPSSLCNYTALKNFWGLPAFRASSGESSRSSLHPCEKRLFIIEKEILPTESDLTELHIAMASFIHPHFEERLAMDFEVLMARLGGNLSLWLGASFLVLLHTAMFVCKLSCNVINGAAAASIWRSQTNERIGAVGVIGLSSNA